MRITELIEKLSNYKEVYGNIVVRIDDPCSPSIPKIQTVSLEKFNEGENEYCILLEGEP